MSADASELGSLADDLMTVEPRLLPKIKPIVTRSALEVKKILQADAKSSKYFKLARTINYDVKSNEFAGDRVIEAEIGPDKTVSGAASLAGIAYFGGSHGGGGTIRDPVEALLEVAPDFLEYIGQAADGVL